VSTPASIKAYIDELLQNTEQWALMLSGAKEHRSGVNTEPYLENDLSASIGKQALH